MGREWTGLFLELWIATAELVVDIAGEILTSAGWERGELLACLVALGVEVAADREKGDWGRDEDGREEGTRDAPSLSALKRHSLSTDTG